METLPLSETYINTYIHLRDCFMTHPVSLCVPVHLDVQRGEVAVQLLGVVDVRFAADGTHHVSDVFVSDGDGEVLPEALVADRALTGRQRLHLEQQQQQKSSFNRSAINAE